MKPARAQGFSLVELMLILVVLAVLAAVAAPSLGKLSSSRENVAATRLRSALIHAQLWAMSSGNATWVDFDASTESATVFVEDPTQPGKSNRVALIDPLTQAAMSIEIDFGGAGIQSVDIGSTNEVHFDAYGAPHNANGTALTTAGIINLNGGIRLTITPNTGLILIN